jgi:ATP/maltotriose-dependent transcriptional regulator MalT
LNDIDKITVRELVILELLKKGLSNEKISGETGITVNTVKFHLKKIYKKLHVINRVQAINKYNEIINKTF